MLEAAVILHSIPTDFAECQRNPFLPTSTAVNGAGANAKPWIPGDAGTRPHWYSSKSKAETGCQKAGCLRLATDAELEGAVPEEGTRRHRVAGRQPHRQGDAAFPDGLAPVAG